MLAFLWHVIIIKTVQQSKHTRERHLTEVLYLPKAVIHVDFVDDEVSVALDGFDGSVSYVLKKHAWKKREDTNLSDSDSTFVP